MNAERTIVYPLRGYSANNVTITRRATWVEHLLPKALQGRTISLFGRIWLPNTSDLSMRYLLRMEDWITFHADFLRQQKSYPLGGLGWLLERLASDETMFLQDCEAHIAVIKPWRLNENEFLHRIAAVRTQLYAGYPKLANEEAITLIGESALSLEETYV